MKKTTTLEEFLSQLDGNDWPCTYMVTYHRPEKLPLTRSGRARLIKYQDSLLIRWDNEIKLELELGEIPVSSFPLYQSIEYDAWENEYSNAPSFAIKIPKWDMYFNL
ncbi:hypothetical protein ACVRYP_04445 [Streptococcus rifensis]